MTMGTKKSAFGCGVREQQISIKMYEAMWSAWEATINMIIDLVDSTESGLRDSSFQYLLIGTQALIIR